MHTIEGGDTSLAAEQSEEEGDIDEDVVPSLSHPALVSAGAGKRRMERGIKAGVSAVDLAGGGEEWES
ncbi:MAG: hypothetical protein TREMPRED_004432 [Tremellales sp. Tagirdzhanova-0007]|nr:MAG: hypothetical protein TREMPRED_004432 [Tremellales sp. Tagirdzhanova-0007]